MMNRGRWTNRHPLDEPPVPQTSPLIRLLERPPESVRHARRRFPSQRRRRLSFSTAGSHTRLSPTTKNSGAIRPVCQDVPAHVSVGQASALAARGSIAFPPRFHVVWAFVVCFQICSSIRPSPFSEKCTDTIPLCCHTWPAVLPACPQSA